ncbi:MAG: response regulator [Deltaproteobacteria bacterium]|nr:response regulator [Deltaproteobacteria bacterium]
MGPLAPALLVEDDPDIREDLADLLRLHGFEVQTAANGAEALAMLQKGPLPGVILLDLMMPVMNGWAFREKQLQDRTLSPIPVIVITGAADPEREASALSAAGFVGKPFDTGQLMRMISRYCS